MTIRDLFAGCHARIEPSEDGWLVSLCAADGPVVLLRGSRDLVEALEAMQAWMLLLTDDTPLQHDVDRDGEVGHVIREALARSVLGEPESFQQTTLRDWFEREMGET